MNLVYGIKDKPKLGQLVLFALQQLLAIMASGLVTLIMVKMSNFTCGELKGRKGTV